MTINTARRLMREDITTMPLEKLQRHKVRLLDAWREATAYWGMAQAVRDGFMVDATTSSMTGYRPTDCWLAHNLNSAYEQAQERERTLLNERTD